MCANHSKFSGNGDYASSCTNTHVDYNYESLLPEAFSTSEIKSIGEFKMVRPLHLETYFDEEGWCHIDCESAGIFAVGSTMEEAKKDFLDELKDAWESYVLESPVDFHESALEYRKWLEENIIGPRV